MQAHKEGMVQVKILVEIKNPLWDWEDYVRAIDNGIFVLDREAEITMELK